MIILLLRKNCKLILHQIHISTNLHQLFQIGAIRKNNGVLFSKQNMFLFHTGTIKNNTFTTCYFSMLSLPLSRSNNPFLF